ncbi:MAG: hypothetical protein FWC10_02715 [Lentimicrobiaceae bacterium]|nr:hypothetical protein [Lentimicrobiaceae bacterium]
MPPKQVHSNRIFDTEITQDGIYPYCRCLKPTDRKNGTDGNEKSTLAHLIFT